MTRWARKVAGAGGKALKSTPWEEMAAGPAEGGPERKNKRKKTYQNEDVNGFAAHLKQAGSGRGLEEEEAVAVAVAAAALKKDRRREGRRLRRQEARKNAMVCFHCREPGHGVADCPAVLESQDMGTGICYRCGSTEHDIGKCKAKIDPAVGAFPYAKCFICGEMGHLSRSCPDNPKGLYAEGGCCRLCGSVEHYRKDCPENQNLDQVTVGRWANGMSADDEETTETTKLQKPKVKVLKVINF
ncbi:zinc finger CCHC domain-containing protein 9 [Centrocercus urophasianus]|uniref:zinc finger CCHC domain-containing protein 9 n=1 Tax=Centrocercus urophasianus TaxID=9002 RepID=UPI001C650566|nr:zinc finger CCHC domain-containing protein 9 [Centrocercus urophasianus]